MKNMMKLAVISSFVAFGVAVANAQNVVLQTTVALTGFKQNADGSASSVRVANKQIISNLNSNGFNFASGAHLVIVQDSNNNLTVQVRDKNGTNDLSGGGTFTVSLSDPVVRGSNGTEYTIVNFNFTDGNGNDFSVSGFATIKRGKLTGHSFGTLEDVPLGAAVQVSGTGHVGGDPAVFRGTVSAGGPKGEPAG